MLPHIPATLLYGSLCTLLILALGAHVSAGRAAKKVFATDAPDKELLRRIRAHGNAIENAPILLLLLLALELSGVAGVTAHLGGGAIFAARLGHAVGMLTRFPLVTAAAGLNSLLLAAMPIYALAVHFVR